MICQNLDRDVSFPSENVKIIIVSRDRDEITFTITDNTSEFTRSITSEYVLTHTVNYTKFEMAHLWQHHQQQQQQQIRTSYCTIFRPLHAIKIQNAI